MLAIEKNCVLKLECCPTENGKREEIFPLQLFDGKASFCIVMVWNSLPTWYHPGKDTHATVKVGQLLVDFFSFWYNLLEIIRGSAAPTLRREEQARLISYMLT